MFKQILLPILAVIVFIVLVGIFVQKSPNIDLSNFISPGATKSSQKTIIIAGKELTVELAKTKESREKGLSGKTSLATDNGMLFVFGDDGANPVFWMKDMLIPIDIIWIKGGKIVKIDKSLEFPKAGTPDSKLKTYSAGQPIDYVLEVNSGYSVKNNISVGDSLDLSRI